MIRGLAIIALLLCSASLSADPLWWTAVEVYRANERWVAGRTEIVTVERNRRGEEKNVERRVFVSQDLNGRVETRLVFAERNGADITESEAGDPDENGEGANEGSPLPNPFDPDLQPAVSFSRTVGDAELQTSGHAAFAFRMKHEDRTYAGTVWIDIDTGVPVALEATMDPLPRFVRFLHFEAEFENDPKRWYPKQVRFEGAGGFLVVYRHFESTMRFSRYFNHDE